MNWKVKFTCWHLFTEIENFMRFPGNPDKKVKNVARRENRREKRERERRGEFSTPKKVLLRKTMHRCNRTIPTKG